MASGDFNTIHTDSQEARRSFVGEQIVHGIHALLASFELYSQSIKGNIYSFDARFISPIKLNSPAIFYLSKDLRSIRIEQGLELCVAIKLDSEFSLEGETEDFTLKHQDMSKKFELEWTFRGSSEVVPLLFPTISALYGTSLIAEILSISDFIGMHTPGKNSLLTRVAGQFVEMKNNVLRIKSVNYEPRIRKWSLEYLGNSLKARIEAIHLRSPDMRFYGMSEISKAVYSEEFSSVDALVIGGSRGLGEITAKLIAAGGGSSTITFNKGVNDANRICRELKNNGLNCRIENLDVNKPFSLPRGNFNQIYYFASPKIEPEKTDVIRARKSQEYNHFFNVGFERLIEKVLDSKQQIVIVYPSTNFIDFPNTDFYEYTKAKINGERLCQKDRLIKGLNVKFLCPRLPRLPTDQTVHLLEHVFEDPIKELLGVIREAKASSKILN